MQQTGIVRRIDELGRVVIPKEIRKTLRIANGDPLEIYSDRDELIIRKYAPLNGVSENAVSAIDALGEMTLKTCVLTSCDKVVYIGGGKIKEYIEKPISTELNKIIHERKSQLLSKADGGKIIPLVKGDDLDVENQIILPIICQGDVYGSVILFDKDRAQRFNSTDVQLVSLTANFLSKSF